MPELLVDESIVALCTEAATLRATGQRNVLVNSAAADARGGEPARAFTIAHGGSVQWTVFNSPALVESLGRICGLATFPAGGGSYSYYEETGDFLSLHRDVEVCDLTVITCLKESGARPGDGLLLVYPQHATGPLSAARDAGREAATEVHIGCWESVALLGGVVPHEVTAMQPGQERIVSVMCYRILVNGVPFS